MAVLIEMRKNYLKTFSSLLYGNVSLSATHTLLNHEGGCGWLNELGRWI